MIKDADNVVNKLQELGKKVFLVTNNSTKSRDEYVAKCAKLGFNCNEVCLSDDFSSAVAGELANYTFALGREGVYLISFNFKSLSHFQLFCCSE